MKKTVFVDDLTGEEASTSLSFGLDDKVYEIDLNEQHAQELRETLDKYVRVAREKMMEPRETGRETTTRQSQKNSKEIRRWAKKQGYAIKGFGRIPATIVHEWENAHGGDAQDSGHHRRMEDRQRDRALSRSQRDSEWEAA